jgi:hypothetical protein
VPHSAKTDQRSGPRSTCASPEPKPYPATGRQGAARSHDVNPRPRSDRRRVCRRQDDRAGESIRALSHVSAGDIVDSKEIEVAPERVQNISLDLWTERPGSHRGGRERGLTFLCQLDCGPPWSGVIAESAARVRGRESWLSNTLWGRRLLYLQKIREVMRGSWNLRSFLHGTSPGRPKGFGGWRGFLRYGFLKTNFVNFLLFLLRLSRWFIRDGGKEQRDCIFVTPIQHSQQRTNPHA